MLSYLAAAFEDPRQARTLGQWATARIAIPLALSLLVWVVFIGHGGPGGRLLGADAQVRDVYRFTPLLRAVDNGYEKTAALLLSLPETELLELPKSQNQGNSSVVPFVAPL